MDRNFLKAVAVLTGYIIGVGMFGLPFLVVRSGVVPFLVLIVLLGAVQMFSHLAFANVIVVNNEDHYLPGYAAKYLGVSGKVVASTAKLIGDIGALLAYLVVTGIFMSDLLGPYLGGGALLYTAIAFVLSAIVIYFGLGWLARIESVMTALMLAAVLIIVAVGANSIVPENYALIEWGKFFLPFGALLFAVDGSGAIPIVVRLVGRDAKRLRRVIIWGAAIPIVIICAFVLTIVGLTGAATTQDSLTGVRNILPGPIVTLSLFFGLLAIATSYLAVAEALKKGLEWDFGWPKQLAWAGAMIIPFGLYLMGFKDLVGIISFAGAVSGGISAIILIFILFELEKRTDHLPLFKRMPNRALLGAIICLFILGIAYEIVNFSVL